MTREEKLREQILKQYKSVRQFCIKMEIPYSTLSTAFERGIGGMAYDTVIKMCEDLSISPIDFTELYTDEPVSEQLLENKIMQRFVGLNKRGRMRIVEQMDDYLKLEKYTTTDTN